MVPPERNARAACRPYRLETRMGIVCTAYAILKFMEFAASLQDCLQFLEQEIGK